MSEDQEDHHCAWPEYLTLPQTRTPALIDPSLLTLLRLLGRRAVSQLCSMLKDRRLEGPSPDDAQPIARRDVANLADRLVGGDCYVVSCQSELSCRMQELHNSQARA